jgi:hypothetical protein
MDQFELVIPTRDGLPHAFVIAREYARLGLRPRYFVDSRSTGFCRFVSKAVLPHAVAISTTGEYVEAMLPEIAASTSREWVIRLDDDEVPSAAFAKWLPNAVASTTKTIIRIPRRAVRFLKQHVVYAGRIPHLEVDDMQCRGFLRAGVSFRPDVHTPGFEVALSDVLHAPEDCCIYHFDWIVRSRSEREAKLRNYERLRSGAWDFFKPQYLPEDLDPDDYDYMPVADPSIVRLAKRLQAAKRLHESMRRVNRVFGSP